MRKLTALLISIAMIGAPRAQAEAVAASGGFSPEQFTRIANQYGKKGAGGHRNKRIAEQIRKLETETAARPVKSNIVAETIGHQGQALLLMMIVSGVEIVRQEVELAHLKKESLNTNEALALSAQAAEQILLGGRTWTSTGGFFLASAVAYKPMKLMQALIQNAKTYSILKSFLTTAIASSVVFAGWELGGQLWDEARELLDNEADYERVSSLGRDLLVGVFSANHQGTKDNLRVARMMVSNMFKILFLDNELRNLWLYNAWRFRIATGGFVELVAGMAAVMSIGTAIFPGAGTAAALMFGVVGGSLVLFVPDEATDRITESIANARMKYHLTIAQALRGQLKELNETSAHLTLQLTERTDETLRNLEITRISIFTIQFESLHRQYERLQLMLGQRKVAAEHDNTPAKNELTAKIRNQIEAMNGRLQSISNFVAKEKLRLSSLRRSDPAVSGLYDKQLADLDRTMKALINLSMGLLPDDDGKASDHSAELLLRKIYLFGFDSSLLN